MVLVVGTEAVEDMAEAMAEGVTAEADTVVAAVVGTAVDTVGTEAMVEETEEGLPHPIADDPMTDDLLLLTEDADIPVLGVDRIRQVCRLLFSWHFYFICFP